MERKIVDQLRELSKDDQSFKKLKSLFGKLSYERDQYKNHRDLLERAIENDYDCILITELDLEKPGPKIVYANNGVKKMTGYSRQEVLGKTPRILQGPKTERKVLDTLKKQLSDGQSFFGQTVNYKKDGSEFINQWDIHPLTDEGGNVTHWVSFQHDITERKRAEKKLMDIQVEFDDLREEIARTVVDIDAEGNIIMANKAFRVLSGYKKDELNHLKIWELCPERYREPLKSYFYRQITTDNFEGQEFKGIIKHKTGVSIQIEGYTRVLELKNQNVIRADIRNISFQKKVLNTLKQRNVEFDRIVETASDFSYRMRLEDQSLQLDYVSEQFPAITGFSAGQILRQGLSQLVHPDDRVEFHRHHQHVLEGKSSTCSYRLKNIEGEYLDVIDYAKPDLDDQTNVKGIRGAVNLQE